LAKPGRATQSKAKAWLRREMRGDAKQGKGTALSGKARQRHSNENLGQAKAKRSKAMYRKNKGAVEYQPRKIKKL